MNLWQEFVRPQTVEGALLALRDAPADALPIAGGTDLLLDLGQGRHSPATTLVDLTSVAEMRLLELREHALCIGAAVSLTAVARNPLTARHAAALVEACDLIGGPQVRNVATLGGNVAHALPAADGTIALLALNSTVEVASLAGRRTLPLGAIFAGPGKSTLNAGQEILVGFRIPALRALEASAFQRIMRPQGVALPIVNVAVWMRRRADLVDDVRIAIGPSGPTPQRARDAEKALTGKPFSVSVCAAAVEALLSKVNFRSSPRRASADYRRDLIGGLMTHTLESAWERTSL